MIGNLKSNTMNIKELSIGNWVDFQGTPCRIKEIHKNGALKLEHDVEIDGRVYNDLELTTTSDHILDDIKPIELTSEFIGKNKDNFGDKLYLLMTLIPHIKYVHRLQNMLTSLESTGDITV